MKTSGASISFRKVFHFLSHSTSVCDLLHSWALTWKTADVFLAGRWRQLKVLQVYLCQSIYNIEHRHFAGLVKDQVFLKAAGSSCLCLALRHLMLHLTHLHTHCKLGWNWFQLLCFTVPRKVLLSTTSFCVELKGIWKASVILTWMFLMKDTVTRSSNSFRGV